MRGARLARVAILGAVLGAGGCSLVLDFSDRQDAGGGNPRCDTFEPNDVAAGAPQLAPGTNELALCGDDIDFFTLVVAADQDVILMTSSTAPIDLELALLQGANAVQISDAANSADEVIERSADLANRLDPGEYTIRVQPVPAGQQGDYDLILETGFDQADAGVDASGT